MISGNFFHVWHPDTIFCFLDCADQAQRLASRLDARSVILERHVFPDGESLVRAGGVPRRVALFQRLDHPNAKIMDMLLAAAAIRNCGAETVTLIAPYLPYMRQDRAFRTGEAVSQKVFGNLLAAHFDGLITVDPHLHRTGSLIDVMAGKPALALSAGVAIAKYARLHNLSPLTLVLGPDEESKALVDGVAGRLGLKGQTARKTRNADRDVDIVLPDLLEVAGRMVIVVDDIISSGATLSALATQLKKRGAGSVDFYATHALCDHAAGRLLHESGVRYFVSSDSVIHPSNGIEIVDVIADGIKTAGASA